MMHLVRNDWSTEHFIMAYQILHLNHSLSLLFLWRLQVVQADESDGILTTCKEPFQKTESFLLFEQRVPRVFWIVLFMVEWRHKAPSFGKKFNSSLKLSIIG